MEPIQFKNGSDNMFNIHPDHGVPPGSNGWTFNNETGGHWDDVHMGENGRRLFARIACVF